ncbi:hypothetical protein AAL_08129 [Moelleriella libera RCEF 2490]|uniref:Invertebrate defensins family profile domain-containing protein n=1 Tax=Moelleriella libera RCEF 2490 TaxID=1081109 RepID=A0A167W3S1_9HYPO|nr:hypothetical protein AAL_08129 [Moelleriella libera RCEF 2490]
MHLLNATLLLAVLAFTSNASPMSNYGEDVKQALSMPENATDDQVKAALFGLFRGCPFDNEACAQSCVERREGKTGTCGGFLWLSCNCEAGPKRGGGPKPKPGRNPGRMPGKRPDKRPGWKKGSIESEVPGISDQADPESTIGLP